MVYFTSSREKRLWLYALLVAAAILSVLAIGRPLQKLFLNQNVQLVFFLTGMILTGITIVIHGLKERPSKRELSIWIGLAAVYIMFIFRLGAPERSHVMEYSVLAILIHLALLERHRHRSQVWIPGLLAFGGTCLIGILDEGIQLILPERVFDTNDIIFNCTASFMAIGGSMILGWAKKKFRHIKKIE